MMICFKYGSSFYAYHHCPKTWNQAMEYCKKAQDFELYYPSTVAEIEGIVEKLSSFKASGKINLHV